VKVTPEREKKLQREFSIAGWNGMMKDLRRILKAHPNAVHWADPLGGMTALHGAAAQCHTDVIQWLLEKGSDINARDDKGRTPLMHAAGNGGQTHVQALLDAGADIALRDKEGNDAIYYTSNLMPQSRNADIIRRHARGLEEKKRQERENRRRADIEGAAAEMLAGTAKPLPVGKPLRLKL
jgi:ankyrin repeat protein